MYVPVNYETRASLTSDIEWDAHIQGPMAEDPDSMMVWRDLTVTVCWVLLSLLGFPDTVPAHDGEGKQLTPEEYKDLTIEMEHIYRKCKGNPHMKEAGQAILEAIRQTWKEFRSLKVRRDGFVGLGPLFCSVKKRPSFYKYVEAGSG
jgi:hypothetical protein